MRHALWAENGVSLQNKAMLRSMTGGAMLRAIAVQNEKVDDVTSIRSTHNARRPRISSFDNMRRQAGNRRYPETILCVSLAAPAYACVFLSTPRPRRGS